MFQKFRYVILLLCLFSSSSLLAQPLDHSAWDALLKKHLIVKQNGAITQVDYAAFARDRKSLKAYLKYLAAIEERAFDQLSKDAQLAMLINLYNAATVELILTGRNAPKELIAIADYANDVRSLRHPFDKKRGNVVDTQDDTRNGRKGA